MAVWRLLSLGLILVPLLMLVSPLLRSQSRLFSQHRSFLQLCKISKQFAIRLNTFRYPCLVKKVWYCKIILPKVVWVLKSKKCLPESYLRNLGSYREYCVRWSYTMRKLLAGRISLPSMMLSIFQTKGKLFDGEFGKAMFPEELWIWNDFLSLKDKKKIKNWSNWMWRGSERRQAWADSETELNPWQWDRTAGCFINACVLYPTVAKSVS